MTPRTRLDRLQRWTREVPPAMRIVAASCATLLVLATVLAGRVQPRLEAETAALKAQAQSVRARSPWTGQHRSDTASGAGSGPQSVAADRFGATGERRFIASFPPAAQRAQRVATLLATAERHGVQIERAEFRNTLPEAALALSAQRVVLPVRASWPAMMAFAGSALEQDPALALVALRAQRDNTGGMLRGELGFVLYAQAEAAAAGTAIAAATGGTRAAP